MAIIPVEVPKGGAVEFAHHSHRMCLAYEDCEGCPLDKPAAAMADHSCMRYQQDYPNEAVALVAEWAAAHPETAEQEAGEGGMETNV